jgi:ATP-binding cassette subfamily B protein
VFHYDDDTSTRILNDINFSLPPGRVLGLLGRTGSGKTTLSRLLLRFYDPVSGSICVGNGLGDVINIREAKRTSLRNRIGLVTQDVELFHAPVRDNLTLFDETVEDGRVLDALNDLGMGPWLASLPDGLNTRIEAGDSLSAGEAQLLALGRVFLADAGLIILDEASSRLDPATEQMLDQALTRLLTQRTAIIIAHRLATINRADDILILSDGQILEFGERTTLLDNPDSQLNQLMRIGMEEALV